MDFLKSRKFRQGSAATVITILAVALVVVINMVASALSSRYSLSLDLTTGGIFTLSQESTEFLKTVQKPVHVYVLSEEEAFTSNGEYYMQANEVVKRYSQQNDNITLSYINIVKNPDFVSGYADLTLNAGSILVECEGHTVVLTAYDLFNTQVDSTTYTTSITSSKAEQALSSAILNVTSDKKITVSVLSGHNEPAIAEFTALLKTNNFEIIEQNLLTEDISPDAAIAILCAPTRDISEAEAKKIDAFLKNDGHYEKTFFYLASLQQSDMPMLDAYLAEWGVRVNPGVVFETNTGKLFDYNYYMTIADYMEDEYSKSAKAKKLPAALANSRPLEILFEAKNGIGTTGLLEFSSTAGIRPPDAPEDWAPSASDASGPIIGLMMAQIAKYEELTPVYSTVIVSGSETLIAPSLIGSPSLANSEYLLGLLGTLAGKEETVSIQNKTIGRDSIGITGAQQIGIGLTLTIIFPLAVLILGIVIWLRRRHK